MKIKNKIWILTLTVSHHCFVTNTVNKENEIIAINIGKENILHFIDNYIPLGSK